MFALVLLEEEVGLEEVIHPQGRELLVNFGWDETPSSSFISSSSSFRKGHAGHLLLLLLLLLSSFLHHHLRQVQPGGPVVWVGSNRLEEDGLC